MNKRIYYFDNVTCNIMIDGSAALGNLGNSSIDLVNSSSNGKKCMPDLITYSVIINVYAKLVTLMKLESSLR